jgi:dUTP pyrophosphatase
MTLKISIQKVNHGCNLDLPFYATEQSAGMDLNAAIPKEVVIEAGQRQMIPTGIAIALPVGYEAQIRPRSGLAAKHGITVLNSPGTIDADYRGEIIAILHNHSNETFTVTPGMRVAQMIIAPVTQIVWSEQKELGTTERDDKGFGSTGL